MKGMDTVIKLRRSRCKPAAVFVDLVANHDRDLYRVGPTGIVCVEIAAGESIADIDFRPLIGLHVHLSDIAGNHERVRQVAKAIAAVRPSILVAPRSDGGFHALQDGNPPLTETYPCVS